MIYKQLGRTDLNVSLLCLGSMTWGTQNTAAEGHAQIDMALDHGINFIDTAEMYPTNPLSKETQGDTERVIGQWVEKSGRREEVIIATKVSGEGYMNVRDGAPISPATIRTALETSLRSMRTDYVDLYQLHWPNRGSYMFRKNWHYDPTGQDRAATFAHMQEVLDCLETLRGEGKIAMSACRTRAHGERRSGFGSLKMPHCRAWLRSRMNIPCCAGYSTPTSPNSHITRMSGFLPSRPSLVAC